MTPLIPEKGSFFRNRVLLYNNFLISKTAETFFRLASPTETLSFYAPMRHPKKRKSGTTSDKRLTSNAKSADKHILYERSVQNTESAIEVIEDVYKHERNGLPDTLREDFCGTAKLCADWVKTGPDRRALGVDMDRPTLDWAFSHNIEPLSPDEKNRVELVESDVLECGSAPFDVICAFNFSYWTFQKRAILKRYFEKVFACLEDDGLFLLDIYGGPDSQFVMEEETEHDDFTYVWDQAEVDAINNHTICHIHFRFEDGSELTEAFTYDWRIWSMPELRDILDEVGFKKVVAWWDCEDDVLRPKKQAENLISWVAYLAAWR